MNLTEVTSLIMKFLDSPIKPEIPAKLSRGVCWVTREQYDRLAELDLLSPDTEVIIMGGSQRGLEPHAPKSSP